MTETIGIIGAGTMGNGIAQTAAASGFDVVMCDVSAEFVERGVFNIGKSLDRFVKKETMSEAGKAEVLRGSKPLPPFKSKSLFARCRGGYGEFRGQETDLSTVGSDLRAQV